MFGLLANERRQRTVQHLAETPEPATITELVDRIARDESHRTDADRIATSLVHVHLPKLTDAGVVRHDGERIALQIPAAQLSPYLALCSSGTAD